MGGMAEIFRATTNTEGFEKQVCIKRILPHYVESDDFIAMFRDEAALAARLQHANIVQVFDFGQVDDTLYLAMEYIDGADLRNLQRIAIDHHAHLQLGQILNIGIALCRGLHHAHTREHGGSPLQIVHRDVSPHNILLSAFGEVKLTDFGIAKAAQRATHTSTGVVKGKLSYMAPEQLDGSQMDHRVDQFASGIVLWELLAQQPLFAGDNEASIIRQVMMCDIESPSDLRTEIPRDVSDVILRALAPSPDRRFQNMKAFEHELNRLLFSHCQDPSSTDLESWVSHLLDRRKTKRRTALMPALSHDHPTPQQVAQATTKQSAPDMSSSVSHVFTRAHSSSVFSPGGSGPPPPSTPSTQSHASPDDASTLIDDTPLSSLQEHEANTSPTGFHTHSVQNAVVHEMRRAEENTIAPDKRDTRRRRIAAFFSVLTMIVIASFLLWGGPSAKRHSLPAPATSSLSPSADPTIGTDNKANAALPNPSSSNQETTTLDDSEPDTAKRTHTKPKKPAALSPAAPVSPKQSQKTRQNKTIRRAKTKAAKVGNQQQRAMGVLFIDVKNSWAQVFRDDVKIGETPLQLQFPIGLHTLKLVNPDTFQTKFVKVLVRQDQRSEYRIKFSTD